MLKYKSIIISFGVSLLILGAGCAGESNTNTSRSNVTDTSCDIKGNISSSGEKIYHLPGDEYYDETVINPAKGERWFCAPEEAEAAGWRHAKSDINPNKQTQQDSTTYGSMEDGAALNYNDLEQKALENLQTKQRNFTVIHNRKNYTNFQIGANGTIILFDPSTNDQLILEVQDVGSLAPNSSGFETWMWAWANSSIPAKESSDSLKVKEFGEKNDASIKDTSMMGALFGINPLTESVFQSDKVDAESMAAIALYLTGGEGIYKVPFTNANGTASNYFLIKKITEK